MKQQTKKINRRSFIEQTTKLTVGGFMLSQLTAKSKKLSTVEGEIRVAVVGCGGRGTGACNTMASVGTALEAPKRLVRMPSCQRRHRYGQRPHFQQQST